MAILRWLGKNIGTLIMAFILSMIVWISAVIAGDPNVEQALGRAIPLEVINLDEDLLIMNEVPNQVRTTLNAPSSRWRQLTADPRSVRASINLANLGSGEHIVEVEIQPTISPVRVVQADPSEVRVILEPRVSRTLPVNLTVEGEPALGYTAGTPTLEPEAVVVSGPATLVSLVNEARIHLEISGERQTIETSLPVRLLDQNGQPVLDENVNTAGSISVFPDAVNVTQPVTLLGGYRNVIVRVDTEETSPASGYRLTNIVVTPPSVVVFSSNPRLVNELPGYIETQPLDLTDVDEDIETFLELNTPGGITVVNDQKVLVQVSISPIESNLMIALPVEAIGLPPGLVAYVSPELVDVILSGPVPVLDGLKVGDVRLVVDMNGRAEGTYQLTPTVAHLPNRVQSESIRPNTVEVTIAVAPTPTETTDTPNPTTTPTSGP